MNNFPSDVTFHPDRLLTPLKRIGEKGKAEFEKISWDQAITEIADKLKTIIDQTMKFRAAMKTNRLAALPF